MSEATTDRPDIQDNRLTAEQTVEVLKLLKGSNSVELKTILSDEHRGTLRRLGFDPVEGEPRQSYFFDTPDLKLSNAGVIVRTRRGPRGRGDTVVKLRPVDPATIDANLRRDPTFKLEVDVQPGGFVCSCSAKGRCSAQEVLDVSDGKIPLESIFSRQQSGFYAAHAPAELPMKALVPLGPIFLLRLKQQPKGFDRPVLVELWFFPDGSRILELSTKGVPQEAFQLGAEFRGFMASCGIPLERTSVMKTSSALAYFSKQLKG